MTTNQRTTIMDRRPLSYLVREGTPGKVTGPVDGREAFDRIMVAHGGRESWAGVAGIHARLSTGGLAYATRGIRSSGIDLQVAVRPAERVVEIADYPCTGWWGKWHDDQVWVGPSGGPFSDARSQMRQRFKGWIRHPRWDALDLLYFLGYALWNYLSFPILLGHPGTRIRIVRGGQVGQPTILAVRFPAELPTHSQDQRFHLDASGFLRRQDYVAEVFGTWAAGANHCLHAETVDGLRLYTRRRVVPALGGRVALPGPTLVWIHLDEVQVHRRVQPPLANGPVGATDPGAPAAWSQR